MPKPEDKPEKPKKVKIKEVELDVCPICGGRGLYIGMFGDYTTCHACKGVGQMKIVDFSTIKSKRIKVENDRKNAHN